jgi:hypothetical protein
MKIYSIVLLSSLLMYLVQSAPNAPLSTDCSRSRDDIDTAPRLFQEQLLGSVHDIPGTCSGVSLSL